MTVSVSTSHLMRVISGVIVRLLHPGQQISPDKRAGFTDILKPCDSPSSHSGELVCSLTGLSCGYECEKKKTLLIRWLSPTKSHFLSPLKRKKLLQCMKCAFVSPSEPLTAFIRVKDERTDRMGDIKTN